jgi:hypothetical protein
MKYLFVLPLFLAGGVAFAADGDLRHGFWGNIDIGFGNLQRTPDLAPADTGTHVYLALAGGYTLHPQLQLGVEAGGWSISAADGWKSDTGEGLRQLFALVRYWPTESSRLYLSVAGGSVVHWNNAPGTDNGNGSGYTVGLGYEIVRYAALGTQLFLAYSAGSITGYKPVGGEAQGEDYSALTAGLRLGF